MNMNTPSTPNAIEIVWLRRISQSQPTAWEGRTRNQETVHVFYKYGRLEVWMRQGVQGIPGAQKWVTLLSFYPEWMEEELAIERNWVETRRIQGGSLATAKRAAKMLFERKIAGEMRAANDGRPDEFGDTRSRVITVGQLSHWLSMRNKELVRRNGAASSLVLVEIVAWSD